jgi:hypothetical protein
MIAIPHFTRWAMRLATVVALVTVAACSSDSNPGSPDDDDDDSNPPVNCTSAPCVTATIDGTPQSFTVVTTGWAGPGSSFAVNCANTSFIFGFGVSVPGPGSYSIPGSGSHVFSQSAVLTAGASGWTANQGQGSGNITFNSLTTTGASGTFSFVMPPTPLSGTTGAARRVENGIFNVRF